MLAQHLSEHQIPGRPVPPENWHLTVRFLLGYHVQLGQALPTFVQGQPDDRCLGGAREGAEATEGYCKGTAQIRLIECSEQSLHRNLVDGSEESNRQVPILRRDRSARDLVLGKVLGEHDPHL